MADILLFGATGYTGRLTAGVLSRQGADFAIAGRNRTKLEELASSTGRPDIHVVEAGDVDGLVGALEGAKVLITCVGPFVEFGDTAVEAALRAGVHYIDSTGEGLFIERLIRERDAQAHASSITIAPAFGFDEAPGDLACALAAEELDAPELWVTYAVPRTASSGTLRSALGILGSRAPWLETGKPRMVRAGEEQRWAPMPPPLGPRSARSFPLALCYLAPRHTDPHSFRTYVTTGAVEGAAMKWAIPLLRLAVSTPASSVVQSWLERQPEGPDEEQRAAGKWTILVEARSASTDGWRNVTVTGTDVYGLTADLLTAAALEMSKPGYQRSGVLSPVQALGKTGLQEILSRSGVSFGTYAPV